MATEGMVHALKQIHNLLSPNGRLIDMHPNGEPPPITVRLGEEQHLVGWVRELSDYESYALAGEALKTAVSHNLYQMQSQDTFAFITICDTLADLQHYLANEWSDAFLEDLVAMQIESILRTSTSDQEIILKEIVKISHLQPQ